MGPDFLITTLLVVASPGAGVVLTLAAGLSQGGRAAVLTALGCTLGIVPHMLAAITGLAALLQASPTAFTALKVIGVVYLLVMAVQSLRDGGVLSVQADQAPRSAAGLIRHAILVNLINPKLSIFFLAFLPQFIDPANPAPARLMGVLSAVFMAVTFAVFAVYGLFSAAVRTHVLARPAVVRWLRRGFAAAFAGLGLKLALMAP